MSNDPQSISPPVRVPYIENIRQLIQAARHRVFVLNWPASEPNASTDLDTARSQYFDDLLNLSGDVKYSRIVQVRDGESHNLPDTYDALYVDHFRKMVAKWESCRYGNQEPTVELLTTLLTIPVTFMLVDNVHVAFEVNELANPGQSEMSSWRSREAFVLRDASEGSIAGFMRIAAQLSRYSRVVMDPESLRGRRAGGHGPTRK